MVPWLLPFGIKLVIGDWCAGPPPGLISIADELGKEEISKELAMCVTCTGVDHKQKEL